jgi:hypothetical protein
MPHLVRGGLVLSTPPGNQDEFVVFRDTLVVGPCSPSPGLHAAKRRIVGGDELQNETDRLREVLQSKPKNLVIWSSKDWADIVFSWWVGSMIHQSDLESDVRLAICELDCPRPSLNEEEFDSAMDTATCLRASEINSMRQCWTAFTSDCPQKVLEAVSSYFVDLSRDFVPRYLAMFPRLNGEHFKLSPFDEQLLGRFSGDGWLRPVDVVELFHVTLAFVPPRLVLSRINEFASTAIAFLENQPSTGDSPWGNGYRLSRRGSEVLRDGVEQLPDVPALSLGGMNIYSAGSWARDEELQRFVKIDR